MRSRFMTTVRKMISRKPGFFEDYLYWLIGQVCDNAHKASNYISLFNLLQETEFYWSIDLDENRAYDGLKLRDLYISKGGKLSQVDINRPVSMLEVLVAMAIRCEDDKMHEDSLGDRTPVWFWGMIKNASLLSEDDDNIDDIYVRARLKDILDRNYGRHGEGGLFYTNDLSCHRNFKRIELWEQLGHWLNYAYPDTL